MEPAQLLTELFSRLATPFAGEAILDRLPDLVFFIKNHRGEYVVVNQTLVERCGCRAKRELLGRRADQLFPPPLGESFRAQDESVLRRGRVVLDQLELHFYPSRRQGWCLTSKLPLLDRDGQVVGLAGVSRDLQSVVAGGEDYAAVAKAVLHIQRNFGGELRVAELARRVGLSGYQFERRIHKIFQLTAGQLIHKTRLEAALRRLAETDDPVADIALDCGYSDQSAFTRKFRQTLGLTPSVYRTQQRGK